MRKTRLVAILSVFIGLLLSTVPLAASEWELSADSARGTMADVKVQPGLITLQPRVEFTKMVVTVSGPDGEVYKAVHTEAPIMWRMHDEKGQPLPDGRYGFEIRFISDADSDGVGEKSYRTAEPKVVSGSFSIEGGAIDTRYRPFLTEKDAAALRQPAAAPGAPTKAYDDTYLYVSGKISVGIDDGDMRVPLAPLHIRQEGEPSIILEQEDSGTDAIEGQWRILGGDTQFTIGHDPDDSNTERENIVIEEGAPQNQLYLDSAGRIGFGTSNPLSDFHISSTNGTVRIEDTDDSTWLIDEWNGDLTFDVAVVDLTAPDPDDSTGTKMTIQANGNVGIGAFYPEETLEVDGNILMGNTDSLMAERDDGTNQELFTLDANSDVIFNRGSLVAGLPSHLVFGVGAGKRFEVRNSSNTPMFRVYNSSGNVAFGNFNPGHPLQMASGAHVTAGGVWTNASSRSLKTDINDLKTADAVAALAGMEPVTFRYKADESQQYVGFIAEDVPDLVASGDRKGLSSMDVVAVLTAVVKDQRATIDTQDEAIANLLQRVSQLEKLVGTALQ